MPRRRPGGIPFEDWMEDLKAFQQEQGHANPRAASKDPREKRLGNWLSLARGRRYGKIASRPNLTDPEVALLSTIPTFEWHPPRRPKNRPVQRKDGHSFDEWLEQLSKYQAREGHTFPPANDDKAEIAKLGRWVTMCRSRREKRMGTRAPLTAAEREQLLAIPTFTWAKENPKPYERSWMERFQELQAYYEETQTSLMTRSFPNDPVLQSLTNWERKQRLRKTKKVGNQRALNTEEIALLDSIGFQWNPPSRKGDNLVREAEYSFEERLQILQEFRDETGHCLAKKGVMPDTLRRWVFRMRMRKTRRVGNSPQLLRESIIEQTNESGYQRKAVLRTKKVVPSTVNLKPSGVLFNR